jgi:hypothetical protein
MLYVVLQKHIGGIEWDRTGQHKRDQHKREGVRKEGRIELTWWKLKGSGYIFEFLEVALCS